jgi:hypothetical protein
VADQLLSDSFPESATQEEIAVSYRSVAFRMLVFATAMLAAAFNGGWKWDLHQLPH